MKSTTAVTSEGWGGTQAGTRQHYFRVDGRSLCNRWFTHGERPASAQQKCAGCKRLLALRQATQAGASAAA